MYGTVLLVSPIPAIKAINFSFRVPGFIKLLKKILKKNFVYTLMTAPVL